MIQSTKNIIKGAIPSLLVFSIANIVFAQPKVNSLPTSFNINNFLGTTTTIIGGLIVLALLGFWIVMLVHAISNRIQKKGLWIFLLIILGLLGAVLYLFIVIRPFKESLAYGWKKFKDQYATLIAIVLGILLINVLFSWLQSTTNNEFAVISVGIINLVVSLVLGIGWGAYTLSIARNEGGKPGDFITHAYKILSFFIASLLYSILTFIGFILFVAPGMYLAARYGFFMYAIIDGSTNPITALSNSAQLTKNYRWRIVGLMSIIAIINLVSSLLGGIVVLVLQPPQIWVQPIASIFMLITVPITAITFAKSYETLRTIDSSSAENEAHTSETHDATPKEATNDTNKDDNE